MVAEIRGERDQLDGEMKEHGEAIPSMKSEVYDQVVDHLRGVLARARIESYQARYHDAKEGRDFALPSSDKQCLELYFCCNIFTPHYGHSL